MMHDEIMTKLSEIFQASISEIIETASGIRVSMTDETELRDENDSFAGVLPFTGYVSGLFIVKCSESSLRKLTSFITGSDENSIDAKEMADCIGELANMICGSARARAATAKIGFIISTPFSILGTEKIEFFFKKNARMLSLSFSSEDIFINARVVFV